MNSIVIFLAVVSIPVLAWADPPVPEVNAATAEYDFFTGEFCISSNNAVTVFVQSASSRLTPIDPAPVVPVGLLTNSTSRVGITNLGPINLTNYCFGSIGAGFEKSELLLVFIPALGQKSVAIAAGAAGFRYIPEPASFGLVGCGLIGVLSTRRRQR